MTTFRPNKFRLRDQGERIYAPCLCWSIQATPCSASDMLLTAQASTRKIDKRNLLQMFLTIIKIIDKLKEGKKHEIYESIFQYKILISLVIFCSWSKGLFAFIFYFRWLFWAMVHATLGQDMPTSLRMSRGVV